MSSKMANMGPHAAGIFADMTVDGPEIGTLVVIVDRGKNLPNKKTMGKQNPYCAARLGKEARKTEVDKRGGQTPRWDQELRFTVHDSPDYYKLKISVFNEDKRTDLIGEAWVDLDSIITPGGGKGDLWQALACKGKYAGEVRAELTYYDSREKQETKQETVSMADELRQQYGTLQPKVPRRPLPTNPNAPATVEVMIPERPMPGRAKHGPRDFQVGARMNSASAAAKTFNYPLSESTLFGQKGVQAHSHGASPVSAVHSDPVLHQHYEEFEQNPDPDVYPAAPAQHDFLPQLGPSTRARGSSPPKPRQGQRQQSQPRPLSHVGIPHSHSAPIVPVAHPSDPQAYDDSHQLRTEHNGPTPDLDYQYQQSALARPRRIDVPPDWQSEFSGAFSDRQAFVEEDLGSSPPPPPPMHSNSAPVVPHSRSQQHQPPTTRPRTLQSSDESGGEMPYPRNHRSTPNLSPSTSQQSAVHHANTSPIGWLASGRNTIAEPYGTPPRQPHPLSQEIPRARSPNPHGTPAHHLPYNRYHSARENSVPLIKPRAISPAPTSAQSTRSTYSLQFPVRAFESSETSPLSTSIKMRTNSMPRKLVSPRPSTSEDNRSAAPFSPDDFGAHHPTAPGAEASSRDGPIVGWHGQEIDPSDHLPVDSWAPEPTKKTPSKTYGLGREKEFGPRSLSKDTVINVRMKSGVNMPEQQIQPASSGKIRGVLKKASSQPRYASEPPLEPMSHHAYSRGADSYEQQHPYHRSFREEDPGGYGPPSLPPKLPLSQSTGSYGEDALSREISSIDIGGSSSSARHAGAVFVPVQSHRDRHSYY